MVRLAFILAVAPRVAFGYGEPDGDGVPSSRERLLHVFTNQVRQDPHAWPGWDTSLASSEARSPLAMEQGLYAAARFHADDMSANDCFQHESCDGTLFETRLARYFSGAGGENIYAAFGDDSARTAITAWMSSDGHRTNILLGVWTHLGAGSSLERGQVFYVQDFGQTRTAVPPIPAAAFETRAGDVLLIATWFDADDRPPRSFEAILEGRSIAMPRIAGKDGNETRAASVEAIADCAELTFVATSIDGDDTVFPTIGALLAGEGCSADYSAMRTGGPQGPKRIDADDPGTGCSASGTGGTALLLLVPWLVLARRLL